MPGEMSQVKPEGSRAPIPIENTYPAKAGPGTSVSIVKKDVFAGAGEKAVSAKQAAVLTAPVDPDDVKILPDTGSLYLPWSWYAARLTKAFGPMGWSIVPVVDKENNPIPPVAKDNTMFREFILTADGRFVASAVGECGYKPGNKRMTFGDAVEGAKSNALSRCCKTLGMAPEIYSEGWRAKWIKEYAVCVLAANWEGKLKENWRRKDGIPLKDEKGHAKGVCPCQACMSGNPPPARDGRAIIDAPIEKPPGEWTGEVKDVRVVSKPQEAERFAVTTTDADFPKFITFSRDVATRAKAMKGTGEEIQIKHKPGQFGPEIVTLAPADQPPDEPEEGGQSEDLAQG